MEKHPTELFSELYNCYYQVVDKILSEASLTPLTERQMTDIACDYGYAETAAAIIPKLISGEWCLLHRDGKNYESKIDNLQVMPLTTLQKSWLKALLADERIGLFFTDDQLHLLAEYLKEYEPLFRQKDFLYFDRYADGDSYGETSYRKHFQLILKAIQEHRVLQITYLSGKKKMLEHSCLPCRLEYSSKDDKFRVLTQRFQQEVRTDSLEVINIGRIVSLRPKDCIPGSPPDMDSFLERSLCQQPVILEISTERNALERTMLHFASYQKRTEKIEGSNHYLCRIYYNKCDETELLIQILSFGPVIRVLGPDDFLSQIRNRVEMQLKRLGQLH